MSLSLADFYLVATINHNKLSIVLYASICSPWWSTHWARDCAWLSSASPACWRCSRGRPPWSRSISRPASSSWRPRTGSPSWSARCRSTGASAGSPMSGRESGSGSNRGCRTCPSLMTCSLSKIGTVLTDGTSKQIFYINISSVKKNSTRDYSTQTMSIWIWIFQQTQNVLFL